MDDYLRHERAYAWLRRLAVPCVCRLLCMESAPVGPVEGPYLVLSNHTTDLDPALVASSFPKHMYFVSSEHALRKGLGGWLLRHFFAPISRMKGGTDAAAAMGVLRKLRAGANVCLFAEGDRSFNGRTGPLLAATGKLVKTARCSLITYKLEGGYLTSPRWSTSLRRGKMKGYPVRVYTPGELASMTATDINARIAEDLYEDADAREALERVPFRGARLAEALETALFLCPQCGAAGSLTSKGNALYCTCGLNAVYDVYGNLHNAPFETVSAWDDWQLAALPARVRRGGMLCADPKAALSQVGAAVETLAEGPISLTPELLTVGDARMPVKEISGMALIGRNRVMLTFAGRHLQLSGPRRFCGRKYLLFYRVLKKPGAENLPEEE